MKVLFAGSYTTNQPHVANAKGKGITSYELTVDNGKPSLKELTMVEAGADPTFLTITHNKRFLYSTSEGDGKLYAFRISSQGQKLEKIGVWSTGGKWPCYVSTDKDDRFVFVSNYMSGSVQSYRIQEDGSLVPDKSHQYTGHSNVLPQRQEGPHAHCFQPDRESKFVYSADLGNDRIYNFTLNPNKPGALVQPHSEQPFVPTPPGSGPRHLTFHPNNKFLYVSCELDNTVIFYEKSENGTITEKQILPTLPPNGAGGDSSGVADIHCTDDGKYLYVSNRDTADQGRDTLAVYRINQNSGQIAIIDHESTRGMIPRNFAIDGNFLYVANQNSDDIVPFTIDEENGKLKFCEEKLSSPSPVCLKIVEF